MSYLTKLPGVLDADDVKPGMAYFANTGPIGKTCETCCYRGYWRNSKGKFNPRTNLIEEKHTFYGGCRMFLKLSGRHGPRIDKKWNACKFYEHKQS
jgi:hypothetical protein